MTNFRKYWDEERETLTKEKREKLILDRLKHQLEYVYSKTSFYRSLYDEHGFKPEDIRYLEDFTEKVPIVTKDMLKTSQAAHPPFGDYLGIEPSEIRQVMSTSGTTGRPTFLALSQDDWDHVGEATAMQCWAGGMRPDDFVQIGSPLAQFVGGWGVFCAAEKIGAKIISTGGVDSERQLMLMRELGTSAFVSTPSFFFYLRDVARNLDIDVASLPLKSGFFVGEPGAGIPEVKRLMEDEWGIQAIDFGNVAEVHPCSNMECEHRTGMHAWIDIDYTEVVQPDQPNVMVPMGDHGAVVYTHLWRRSQPMIRYFAGDETVMIDDDCDCGRTYPRLPYGIIGRLDDMLIIRGVNIYPSALEQAVRATEGIGSEFRVYVQKNGPFDEARIEVESALETKGLQLNEHEKQNLIAAVEGKLRSYLGIRLPVDVVPPESFSKTAGKSRRIIDNR